MLSFELWLEIYWPKLAEQQQFCSAIHYYYMTQGTSVLGGENSVSKSSNSKNSIDPYTISCAMSLRKTPSIKSFLLAVTDENDE